jgi:hypothetical protein
MGCYIGGAPIGHAPAVTTYQSQVHWSSLHPGTVAGTTSGNIASKTLHDPMKETENPTPASPMAW